MHSSLIRINRYLLTALFLSLFFAGKSFSKSPNASQGKMNPVDMVFGHTRHVVFDLHTGTFDVLVAGKKIIDKAFSAIINDGKYISSKDYKNHNVTVTSIQDGFGTGKVYRITSEAANQPTFIQTFYIYPANSYFLMEVSLKGKSLKSNYMAPLISGNVALPENDDLRTLFVPYDNDAWVRYNSKPVKGNFTNVSAEVGVVYNNQTRSGWVLGSVEHGVWKTGMKTTVDNDKVSHVEIWGGLSDEKITHDQIPHGMISGDLIKSPKVLIGCFDDWRKGMEIYAKANRIADKPFVFNWDKPKPFGWNSWGVLQDKLTYDKAIKVVDFFADSLKTFRNGNTMYIDLDAFWNVMVPGGINGDYSKIKQFADYCKMKGLQPGVYLAPFTDWGWKGGPDRKVEGTNYTYGELWTKVKGGYYDFDGGRAIDPTHPGTRQLIATLSKKLLDCGIKMVKIDFLAHGAIESDAFYDKTITTGMQAYRSGMEYLISSLNNQMLVYAAISPSLATGRYVHTRRIACDAFHAIDNTAYTLNSVTYGWWQTFVYNYIDADHIVFDKESEGVNNARITSGLITGTFILGDNYSAHGPWDDRIRQYMQNPELVTLARNNRAFMPVEGNTDDQPGNLFMNKVGNTLYLAVFNFTDHPLPLTVDLNRIGLKKGTKYTFTEIFSQQKGTAKDTLPVNMSMQNAAIYKFAL